MTSNAEGKFKQTDEYEQSNDHPVTESPSLIKVPSLSDLLKKKIKKIIIKSINEQDLTHDLHSTIYKNTVSLLPNG